MRAARFCKHCRVMLEVADNSPHPVSVWGKIFAYFKMADIENWLISWTSSCTNTKEPNKFKRQKAGAILEHISGDFLVGFIAYREHLWHVRLKHQQIHFREVVGALEKSHVSFVRKGYEMVLLSFSCTSIRRIGLVWNWLKTCDELIRNATNYDNFEVFVHENTVNRFKLISPKQARIVNKRTSLSYVWD